MKVERVAFIPHTNSVKKPEGHQDQNKDFSSTFKVRDGANQGIDLPKSSSRELIQDFAEWYFKQGKAYETVKSYKMAISAYEKSNTVEPEIAKANSIDFARSKAYKE